MGSAVHTLNMALGRVNPAAFSLLSVLNLVVLAGTLCSDLGPAGCPRVSGAFTPSHWGELMIYEGAPTMEHQNTFR